MVVGSSAVIAFTADGATSWYWTFLKASQLTLLFSATLMLKHNLPSSATSPGSTPDNLLTVLKRIGKNAQLLLSEVNALLDFRRLDAGGETLNLQSGDMVDHLNSILVSFSDYAEERGIHLAFNHNVDSFVMDYDREKMNKVEMGKNM